MLKLFRKNPNRPLIEALFEAIAHSARQPELFSGLGIPDTVNGRIESLALHLVVVLRRLSWLPAPADDVAKDVTDYFYEQIEGAMREVGVADIKVPKRMKRFAGALLGRAHVYHEALEAGDLDRLAEILAHDVLDKTSTTPEAQKLARYMAAAEKSLSQSDFQDIIAGRLVFPSAGAFSE